MGISEWEARTSKIVIVPKSLSAQTIHHKISWVNPFETDRLFPSDAFNFQGSGWDAVLSISRISAAVTRLLLQSYSGPLFVKLIQSESSRHATPLGNLMATKPSRSSRSDALCPFTCDIPLIWQPSSGTIRRHLVIAVVKSTPTSPLLCRHRLSKLQLDAERRTPCISTLLRILCFTRVIHWHMYCHRIPVNLVLANEYISMATIRHRAESSSEVFHSHDHGLYCHAPR
jgi:hypothetical protein